MPDFQNKDPLQEIKNGINNNSTDHTPEFDPADIRANASLSGACYIAFLFFLPLVMRPDSRFARFHANQGLVLFIFSAIIGVLETVVDVIPIVGGILRAVLGLVTLGLFLFGFVNALNGKAKELPFIGGISLIKY